MEIPEQVVNRSTKARKELYEVFSRGEFPLKKKKRIIDSLGDIDGFDLAFLINFVMSMDISGHLNIVSHTGDILGVTFSRGYITQVDLPDQQVYFGAMMVELGYISKEDLEVALGKTGHHIGQYFLQLKKVTQQQIDRTFRKQTQARLSKLIGHGIYEVTFTDAIENPLAYRVTRRDYFDMCYKWLETHFMDDWLIRHFSAWENHVIQFIDGHSYVIEAFKKPLLLGLPEFGILVRKGVTLKKLNEHYSDQQEMFLRAIYMLHFIGAVQFKDANILESATSNMSVELIRNDLFSGRFVEAFQESKKASQANPNDLTLKIFLLWAKVGHALQSDIHDNVKSFETEIESLTQAQKEMSEVYYIRALLAQLNNDSDASERLYQAAVEKNPIFEKIPIAQNKLLRLFKFFSKPK